MHEMVCPNDGIDRTDVPAIGAANTKCLIDDRDCIRFECGIGKCDGIAPQQICQPLDRFFATGRAQVDRCTVCDDCCSIRPAAGITALRTLYLWQQFVDIFDE